MLPVGTWLQGGRYRIERYLSSGGFGNTYMAINTTFNEPVAIKEFFLKGINGRSYDSMKVSISLPTNKAMFDELSNKFKKEALRLRNLKNDHIVAVHDLFEENGTVYYVMDYIDGESLSSRLKRTEQPLCEQEALQILTQVLDALKVVHEQGLYHLDIKPANIMVNQSGKAILIDFGASKQMNQDGGATTSTSLSYTPGYAPLEQIAQNLNQFGPWTDIYALGATLYYILTLNPLPSPAELLSNNDALPMDDNISPSTQQLVRYMMTPLSANRPHSVDDVLNLMKGIGMKKNNVSDCEETEVILHADKNNNQKLSQNTSQNSQQTKQRNKKRKFIWGLICACGVVFLMFFFSIYILRSTKSSEELFAMAKEFAINNDSIRAIDYYKEAAEMGNAEAQDSLGVCFSEGKWVDKDSIQAVDWWRKAAEQGLATAQCSLGSCYYNGEGVEKDFSQAVNWLRKAADQGNALAQYKLACCYSEGVGVPIDYSQAVYWLRNAAENGEVVAFYALGCCYLEGKGVKKDYLIASSWFFKAAEQGDPRAMNMLAFCYFNGYGVKKDNVEAIYWLRNAAETGFATAQNNLGLEYCNGNRVAKDHSLAVYWWQKAAEQDLPTSQFSLGMCYYKGEGVSKDYVQAVNWWKKAAEQGDANAQYCLGHSYYYGEGVSKDVSLAKYWWQKAADQGDEDAKADLRTYF